jgi:aspartyl protease family protein
VLRTAIFILLVATAIGVLMPSSLTIRSAPNAPSPELEPRGYSLAEEKVSAVAQTPEQASFSSELTLPRQPDGHFYADVDVNGRTIHFLVDTGASGVGMNQEDARSAGLAFAPSEFTVVGQGASGEVLGQPVVIDRMKLGGKSVEQVGGVVLADSEHSLLGQSFLRQFESVTIKDDRMVLR